MNPAYVRPAEDDDDGGGEEWLDPQPLRAEMRPVAKLRDEMVPESIRGWVTDVAHRMQCPLDFVASGTVCMVSGVIGAGCTLRPKERDNWAVVPNLWGGVVGRPGMKKTPAIEDAFRPLRWLEAETKKQHEAAESSHEAEQAAFESQRKALKREMDKRAAKGQDMEEIKEHYANLKPLIAPERKRFITNDATIEKAHELMAQNPRGITIFRDELVGLFVTWDRDDRKDDRYFHLQGWNGYGGYTFDRIGRGTIDTPQLCEVIYGGIQPSKLIGYLALTRNDISNDGLLQRFQLLVYPDEPAGDPIIVDKYPNTVARDRVFDIIQTLAEMDFTAYGAVADEFTRTTSATRSCWQSISASLITIFHAARNGWPANVSSPARSSALTATLPKLLPKLIIRRSALPSPAPFGVRPAPATR